MFSARAMATSTLESSAFDLCQELLLLHVLSIVVRIGHDLVVAGSYRGVLLCLFQAACTHVLVSGFLRWYVQRVYGMRKTNARKGLKATFVWRRFC